MDGELLTVLKWTAVYTGFTFLCTAAGAAAVFFLKPDAKTELAETLSLGFAAGIMTAASVWSLIIPAQEMAQKQGDTPWLIASLGLAAGAGFLKLLDAVLPHLHPGASKPEGPKTKMHRAMLLFLAITAPCFTWWSKSSSLPPICLSILTPARFASFSALSS